MRQISTALILFLLPGTAAASVAPQSPTDAQVDQAIQRACNVLVNNQENYMPDRPVGRLRDNRLAGWQKKEQQRLEGLRKKAGKDAKEWPYEGVYRISGGIIPPGYRVGGTAIVCQALLEAPGVDDERRAAMHRGIEFMLETIHDDPDMKSKKQTNYDVRGWGWAYALKFFLRAQEKGFFDDDKELMARVKETNEHLIDCLEVGQVPGGGWNYAGPRAFSPFMTGSTLIALYQARQAGYEVDQAMVEDALDALETGRGDSTAYAYSGRLRNENEPMEGACARSAVAELVLTRAGRSSVDNLTKAVEGFFVEENWKELLKRKGQQGTHVAPYGVAPYYFMYGHTYAALGAEYLPDEQKEQCRAKMRELLWRTIDNDSSWNDRIFPRSQSYSTAMAILALLAKDLPEVPAWAPNK